MKNKEQLITELQRQKKLLARLETLRGIDTLELEKYNLRDARKIQKMYWLEEGKTWSNKKFTTLQGTLWHVCRGKENENRKNNTIRIYIQTTRHDKCEEYELWHKYGYEKLETIATNIEDVKKYIKEYEDAIEEYDTYIQKLEDHEKYVYSVSRFLRI